MRKKELIELGITGILTIVIIFTFGRAVKKSRFRAVREAKIKTVAWTVLSVSQGDITDSKNLYNLLEQQVKSIKFKRDPFTAATIITERNMQSEVALTGILWDKDKPLAIVNGEIVKKGTRIGNKTLIEIKRDRVILSEGEVLSEIMLEVKPD